jgi:hypothetical protein
VSDRLPRITINEEDDGNGTVRSIIFFAKPGERFPISDTSQ